VVLKGFKKCCISNAMDENDYDTLQNGSEENGNIRSVRQIKALTVMMETVTLTGKGR
jgi:hypothetical protein